jgi:hypothetical protein
VISPPSKATLRKYGLSAGEWLRLAAANDYACPICLRRPPAVNLVTDHEHLRGYAKMPDAERARAVRGTPCRYCNRMYLARGLTSERAERVVEYLRRYESRRLVKAA